MGGWCMTSIDRWLILHVIILIGEGGVQACYTKDTV
jgi:hypothetical protein